MRLLIHETVSCLLAVRNGKLGELATADDAQIDLGEFRNVIESMVNRGDSTVHAEKDGPHFLQLPTDTEQATTYHG